ncbi:MAG: hypothetical protein L3J20_13400 [Flavobacteriaceae bacterium]|nr:hypothetical protein [Flavobacteriaceae bacterium]
MKIYSKEETIKVLDIVIEDIENVSYFSIKEILARHREYNEHEQGYLFVEIKSLGEVYDLFEYIKDSDGLYRLTPKGINLKESEKGFNEFEKSLKPKEKKWYNENWIGYLIAFIVLLFSVYQMKENKSLTNRLIVVEKKLDSLNTKLDYLNVQYDSFEKKLSDLKMKTEQKK